MRYRNYGIPFSDSQRRVAALNWALSTAVRPGRHLVVALVNDGIHKMSTPLTTSLRLTRPRITAGILVRRLEGLGAIPRADTGSIVAVCRGAVSIQCAMVQ